jgi:hypothetical protein
MDISTKINEPNQDSPQVQISSDQDYSYKKRQYYNTNIYSVFWDKEKERLSHVIDLYYKYEMLVEDRQEFTKNYQNKYADQVSIWFEDEMKNVNFQKGKNDEKGIASASVGNTFPFRDVNDYIKEILKIDFNSNSNNTGSKLNIYFINKQDYIDHLTRLKLKAYSEITMFSKERISTELILIEQIENRIAELHRYAYEKYKSTNKKTLDIYYFDYLSKLFTFPRCYDLVVTSDFLSDMCHLLNIKRRSILEFIKQVKGFIESPQSNNQIDSWNSENNKSYNTYIPAAYKYKKYNVLLSAITDLLQFLIAKGFVSQETDISDFRKIFNDTKPDKPIQWLMGIESLAYFIKLLHHDLKLIEPLGNNIWKVTAELFVDKNYHHFEWKKFRNQKTPARAELIYRAIAHLKK